MASMLVASGDAHVALAATDQNPGLPTSEKIVAAANVLLKVYGSMPVHHRKLIEPSAIEIAKIRRPAMRALIVAAPERALLRTLGRASRINLPARLLGTTAEQAQV